MSGKIITSACLALMLQSACTLSFAFEIYSLAPELGSIRAEGDDITLAKGARVPGGSLDSWPRVPYVEMAAAEKVAKTCAVPTLDYPIESYRNTFALACTATHVWVVAEAYCAEGSRDSTDLFKVDIAMGTFETYKWVPTCDQPTALIWAGNSYWLGTSRPIEKYRDQPGSGLIRITPDKERVDFRAYFPELTIVRVIATRSAIFALGLEGVGKVALDSGAEDVRYFDFSVNSADQLVSELRLTPAHPKRSVLLRFFSDIPIAGKSSYLSLFQQAQKRGYVSVDAPSEEMVPFYIDAARRFELQPDERQDYSPRDWAFSYLLNHIMIHRQTFHDEIAVMLREIQTQKHSTRQRKAIAAAQSGLDDPNYKPDLTSVMDLH